MLWVQLPPGPLEEAGGCRLEAGGRVEVASSSRLWSLISSLIRPRRAVWSARHPVKVEATGSNPVGGAGRKARDSRPETGGRFKFTSSYSLRPDSRHGTQTGKAAKLKPWCLWVRLPPMSFEAEGCRPETGGRTDFTPSYSLKPTVSSLTSWVVSLTADCKSVVRKQVRWSTKRFNSFTTHWQARGCRPEAGGQTCFNIFLQPLASSLRPNPGEMVKLVDTRRSERRALEAWEFESPLRH